MPEVAEVAHACALLRRNVLGLTVRRAVLPLDNLLFPVLKTVENPEATIADAEKHLTGATIKSSGRHGKYFWLRFETAIGTPLVMLMHFGMTGRIRLRDVHSHMIFMENGGDKKVLQQKNANLIVNKVKKEDSAIGDEAVAESGSEGEAEPEVWPPKFTKFELFLTNEADRSVELAFSDPRRLARVRFLQGEEYGTDTQLLSMPPLNSLGPDYSKKGSENIHEDPDLNGNKAIFGYSSAFSGDPDPSHHGRPRLTFEEFAQVVLVKKKPIKAFLLDQDFFAGIGNWVSDEILYHAKIHPSEVISKKVLSAANPVLRRLYDSIIYVMEESVRVEGNAKSFPENWLMLHRWGKGRKEPRATTKSGHKVDFQTVGGRTSCFIPELQKPLKKEELPEDGPVQVKEEISRPKKKIAQVKSENGVPKDEVAVTKVRTTRRSRAAATAEVKNEIEEKVEVKKRRRNGQ
ncbi:hypothetical protein OY671_001535 [Metschnikowia pulcherrima]|nr:hypothetical protein OY671_001535 [Metschnikowia pulcherrima]